MMFNAHMYSFCLSRDLEVELLAYKIQAYLRDIGSLVPDHCNKENTATNQVTQISGFLSTYKSYVYTLLWSTVYPALSKKAMHMS